jgi:hypothetical protein
MTTTVSLIDELQAKRTQQAEALTADYHRLVDDLVAGRKPNADKADELLNALGKTMDDLKADVTRRVRRGELKALVAKLPSIEREIASIDAKRAEATRVFNEHELAYEAALEPLEDRRREVVRLQFEAEQADTELAVTCDDPALLREHKETLAEKDRTAALMAKRRDDAEVSEREAARYKQRAATEIRASEADKRSLETLGEKYADDAKKYRVEVKKLEREWNALEKREGALWKRMQQA